MRIGKLRQRVKILTRTTTRNSYSEEIESWPLTATVWGELTPLLAGTREAFAQQGEQFQARVAYQCRLRWRALSPATNRLQVDARVFEVTGVMDPDGRRAELVALCYEVQA